MSNLLYVEACACHHEYTVTVLLILISTTEQPPSLLTIDYRLLTLPVTTLQYTAVTTTVHYSNTNYRLRTVAELILTWLGGLPDPLANHFEIVSCHKMFSESLGKPMELPENAWKAMAHGHPEN